MQLHSRPKSSPAPSLSLIGGPSPSTRRSVRFTPPHDATCHFLAFFHTQGSTTEKKREKITPPKYLLIFE